MQHISAPELAAWLADPNQAKPVLLDVREPWEFELCRIDGSILMPMESIPARQTELDPDSPIICICHHGVRSAHVTAFLERNGFDHVINLSGGVHAWAQQVDPSMPMY